eukprot:Nk52_evm13s233 gene=Nk52_evmTU13s233
MTAFKTANLVRYEGLWDLRRIGGSEGSNGGEEGQAVKDQGDEISLWGLQEWDGDVEEGDEENSSGEYLSDSGTQSFWRSRHWPPSSSRCVSCEEATQAPSAICEKENLFPLTPRDGTAETSPQRTSLHTCDEMDMEPQRKALEGLELGTSERTTPESHFNCPRRKKKKKRVSLINSTTTNTASACALPGPSVLLPDHQRSCFSESECEEVMHMVRKKKNSCSVLHRPGAINQINTRVGRG